MRQEYLTKSFPFLENCPIQVIEDEIMKLEEGDHLLIIEWNSAVLAQHENNDPTHTRAVLVSTITAHGGSNLQDSQCVFGFATTVTFSSCRAALPLWSRSLGPVFSQISNVPYTPGVGRCLLATATNKLIPDVIVESFFESD